MTERIGNGDVVRVRREGDVRIVIVRGAVWKIRVTLTRGSLALHDADTGTLLFAQDSEALGIRSRDGEFDFGGHDREALLTAFVIAWIVMHAEH